MEESAVNAPPELIVKFWQVTVTAKGAKAIEAVRRPLAFAVYMRPVVAISIGLFAVLEGKHYAAAAFGFLKNWF
jgi:hypothetical protein